MVEFKRKPQGASQARFPFDGNGILPMGAESLPANSASDLSGIRKFRVHVLPF
jgi:hypothetical protein